MNEPKFTPGPWRVGKRGNCVVADSEKYITISGGVGDEAVDYYGGNLIGESVGERNAVAIAALPALYSALENLCDSIRLADFEGIPQSDLADMEKRYNEALAALDQARGKV